MNIKMEIFPKVSVIIPVYNTRKYLKKCLDSVMNQTLKEIEIICINDGSTDNSLEILNEYAQRDKRFIIINKANGGAGSARNAGIDVARGEYIGFVDSDDWIEPDMFEVLYNKAKEFNCDVSFCNIRLYDESKKKYIESDFYSHKIFLDYANKRLTLEDFKDKVFDLSLAAWHRVYRTSYIKENKIKFKEVKIEDYIFFFDIFLTAKTFCFTPEYLFNYRIERKNSIMKNKDNGYLTLINGSKYAQKLLEEKGLYEKLAKNFWRTQMQKLFWGLETIKGKYKDTYYKILREFFLENPNLVEQNFVEQEYIEKYSHCLDFETYKEYKNSFKFQKWETVVFNHIFFRYRIKKLQRIEHILGVKKIENNAMVASCYKIISINKKIEELTNVN